MDVHFAPWSTRDRAGQWLALLAPYDADMISDLKAGFPASARRWVPEGKIWLVRSDLEQDLRLLLSRHYPERICGECQSRRPCWIWERPSLLPFGKPEQWPRPKPAAKPAPVQDLAARRRERAAQALGLSLPATEAQIRAAFRSAALVCHPDKGGTHEQFLLIKDAADLLLGSLTSQKAKP